MEFINTPEKQEKEKEYNKYVNKAKKRLKNAELIKYFEEDLNGLIKAKVDIFPNEIKPIVSAKIENISSDKYRVIASFEKVN